MTLSQLLNISVPPFPHMQNWSLLIYKGCHNNIPHTKWLKQYIYFLEVLEVQDQCAIKVLLRVLSLAGRWLPSPCVLPWPLLCALASLVSFSSYKDTSSIGLGPHPYDLI